MKIQVNHYISLIYESLNHLQVVNLFHSKLWNDQLIPVVPASLTWSPARFIFFPQIHSCESTRGWVPSASHHGIQEAQFWCASGAVPISDSSSFRTSHALMHRSWQVKKMGVLGEFTSKNIWIFHGDFNQQKFGEKTHPKVGKSELQLGHVKGKSTGNGGFYFQIKRLLHPSRLYISPFIDPSMYFFLKSVLYNMIYIYIHTRVSPSPPPGEK